MDLSLIGSQKSGLLAQKCGYKMGRGYNSDEVTNTAVTVINSTYIAKCSFAKYKEYPTNHTCLELDRFNLLILNFS